MNFKILGIDHLGIVAKQNQVAHRFFSQILKAKDLGQETVTDQKVVTQFFNFSEQPETNYELLEPLSEDSPIVPFLSKKGGGVHHIALKVDHIEQALLYLKGLGVKLIDNEPRLGAHGKLVAFIHPHSTGGILIELTQ